MARQAPVHYLRPNHAEWSPPALIVLDTETRTVAYPDKDVEVLRCWVGHYFDRRVTKGQTPRDEWAKATTAGELAEWVDGVTRQRETVWLYAHNLSFDLTTTRLPMNLAARHWTVTDAAIGGKAPWLRMAKGKTRLALLDSWSWLPVALEAIGAKVNVGKPPLPAQSDDLAAWYARCHADVTILETALCELLEWWDREQLGRWTITGAQSGWNAYRHKQLTRPVRRTVKGKDGPREKWTTMAAEPVTIDPSPEAVARDRKAVYGGRRATFVIGEHAAGPFLELDLIGAYPTVAATLPLPLGRSRLFDSLPITHPHVGSSRWGIIAQVEVETDVPRWPVRVGRSVWYPVGRFVTTLCGPEIAEARRLGCLRRIGPGEVHRLGRNMAPWAEWVLAVGRGEDENAPAVAQLAAKSWGRSVIGKWAARGFERTQLGTSPGTGWGIEDAWDHTLNLPAQVVDIAGTRWFVTSSETPDNAYPAVLAWIESEVRARLSRVIEALGPGTVLQADTDGMIVAQRTLGTAAARGHLRAPVGTRGAARVAWVLNCLDPVVAPLTIRVKARHDHVHVIGPQHLTLGTVRRFAGIPAMTEPQADGRLKAKLWPKLAWQLANGSPEGYVRPITYPKITGPYPTGWVLADNRVVPLETELSPDGRVRVIPWPRSSYAADGLRRSEHQHPATERYW